MKKIFAMLAILAMMTATGCAQDSKPATQALTKEEVDTKLKAFFEKLNAVPEDGNEIQVVTQMSKDFIKENPNEAGIYVVRSVLASIMSPEELIAYVDNDEFLKQNAMIMEAKQNWLVQMETSEGKMFKDFSAEYEGKVTKLSDYVGKGKYVLVDFWASWCGPCKAEIPNLIKVYNQYKGDKFEVLGVATWDEPADTKKAIEKMSIPYPQMLNAQKAGSDAYGINGIPQIILFGPDGKILKRNLRGAALEKAVAEALK
jgi:thiol-disulfide isomerase/thioredoxin